MMTVKERSILQAAQSVFLRKGLEAASMGDIAQEAGISRPSLHYYHRTKNALFVAILDHAIEEVIPEITQIIKSDTCLRDKLEQIVDHYADLLLNNPLLPHFFVMEMQRDPANLARLIGKHTDLPDLICYLEGHVAPQLSIDLPPREALAQFFNTLYGLLFFPFLTRPLLDEFLFGHDEKKFRQFIGERRRIILSIMTTMIFREDNCGTVSS